MDKRAGRVALTGILVREGLQLSHIYTQGYHCGLMLSFVQFNSGVLPVCTNLPCHGAIFSLPEELGRHRNKPFQDQQNLVWYCFNLFSLSHSSSFLSDWDVCDNLNPISNQARAFSRARGWIMDQQHDLLLGIRLGLHLSHPRDHARHLSVLAGRRQA